MILSDPNPGCQFQNLRLDQMRSFLVLVVVVVIIVVVPAIVAVSIAIVLAIVVLYYDNDR